MLGSAQLSERGSSRRKRTTLDGVRLGIIDNASRKSFEMENVFQLSTYYGSNSTLMVNLLLLPPHRSDVNHADK
jgi:hypothetical protein